MTPVTVTATVPETRSLTLLDRIARNPVGVLVGVLAALVVVTGNIEPAYLSFGGLRNTLLQLAGAFLLPSVAAAVIGGCSIFGGVGSYTGTILGALILSVVNSMLTYLNTGQAVQQIVYGSIVLALAWGYSTLTKRA